MNLLFVINDDIYIFEYQRSLSDFADLTLSFKHYKRCFFQIILYLSSYKLIW